MADSERRASPDTPPHDRESLLLLAPPADDSATAYCRDHHVPDAAAERLPFIVVSTNAPVEHAPGWDEAGRPGVIIAIGDSTRLSATQSGNPDAPASPPETVVATGDLGSMGRTVDDYVTSWSTSGRRPIVCVDSLSGLFGYASVGGVYRFLYVLLRRVDASGGSAHVHADPTLYEEEILRTFFSLFDRVVSFQEGGALL